MPYSTADRKRHVQFYAFDVLIHRGRKVTSLQLEDRRDLLAEALRKVDYPVIRSIPFDAKPADLIRAAKELEIEGIIAKRKESRYRVTEKPSPHWIKIKNRNYSQAEGREELFERA